MGKILVTGGAGYVGSHTIHHLVETGRDPGDIVVFDNLLLGHREFLPPEVIFYEGDLLERSWLEPVFKQHSIDCVLHFANCAYVGESMHKPGRYFENNVGGSLNLLECMLRHGCRRIVFSSSCAAYGDQGPAALIETARAEPVNPYGESKRMVESMLYWYYRIHGIHSVSLRYFNAAGAACGIGERHIPETHLIPLMIETALGRHPAFDIHGNDYPTPDGTCIRDYIHVSDLARAHRLALELLIHRPGCEIINLGSGKGHSILEVLTLLRDITGIGIPVRNAARRPGDAPVLVAGNDKARAMIGWEPEMDLRDILHSAWSWHLREHGRTACDAYPTDVPKDNVMR